MTEMPKPSHKYGYTKDQLDEICRERGISKEEFGWAFGVNTCAVDEKMGVIYYPCDVERALFKLRAPGGRPHLED